MKPNNSVTPSRGKPLYPLPVELFRDLSLSAVVAGLVAALVSYAGPFAVVLEATRAAGLDPALSSSWIWAIALASGISGTLLSVFTRMPILVAWSTPGAAILIASIGGFTFSDAVGAFLFSSLAATVLGVTGWFGRLLTIIPAPIMTALLAGVLLPFVSQGAAVFESSPLVAGVVVVAFLVGKRWADRFAVVIALVSGIGAVAVTCGFRAVDLTVSITQPVITIPTFNPLAILAIGVPLLLVTMASQNAPGLTALTIAGYAPNDRLLVGGVSLVSSIFTVFGGHATNLAAITAAICAGPEAHPDPRRRYIAGIVCGIANVTVALFSSTIVSLFSAVPPGLITILAAVALLGSLLGALTVAVSGSLETSFAALITLVVTASGVTLLGIGSAFWALVAGIVVWLALRKWQPADGVRTR